MILYNFKKILRYSNKSSSEIVKIIRYLTYKPIPYSIYDRNYKYSEIDWSGNSFLCNPELLLYNRYKHSDLEIAHYVGFASLRNLAEYKITGKLTLDFLAYKGKEALIKNNSLLYIKDNQLVFLYEEAKKEN